MNRLYSFDILFAQKLALLVAFAWVISQELVIHLFFDDPFHAGEFFASGIFFTAENELNFLPYTIHGALDFIPFILSKEVFAIDAVFFGTLFFYKFFSLISSIFFILIVNNLLKDSVFKFFFILISSLIVYKFVNIRDLFLLVSLFLFVSILERDKNNLLLGFLFGFSVALGVFWSFDRGVATLVSLGVATLYLSYYDKRFFSPIISFIFVFTIISIFFDPMPLGHYLDNLMMLLNTSSQWKYPWHDHVIKVVLFVVVINIISIYLYVNSVLVDKNKTKKDVALLIALVLLSLLMLKAATNRADDGHIYFSLWVPLLMLFKTKFSKDNFYILGFAGLVLVFWLDRFFIFSMIFFVGIACVLSERFRELLKDNVFYFLLLVLSFSLLLMGNGFNKSNYEWLKSIQNPPTNEQMSTEGVKWVANKLKSYHVNCVFDLANNGIINGLVNAPSCSRFTYPVYATIEYENDLLGDLKKSSPPAIVYSTSYWSYSIDGKSMRERFPLLDEYIVQNYPYEQCEHGYCIRSIRKEQ
jgi:hypothetical protein